MNSSENIFKEKAIPPYDKDVGGFLASNPMKDWFIVNWSLFWTYVRDFCVYSCEDIDSCCRR